MVDAAERLKAAARLRETRKRAGFADAKEATEAYGWPYNTYKAHELGKDRGLSKKAAQRYAAVFRNNPATREVTAGWLLMGENPPTWAPNEHASPKQVAFRTVPKVTYAQAVRLDQVKQVEELGVIAIGADPTLGSRAVALDVVGDSMVAKPRNSADVSFQPGDTIIVDPDTPWQPGDFVLAVANGSKEAIFRKYRMGDIEKGKHTVELAALNEDYGTIRFNRRNPGRIIGKMVRHIRRF